jgi:hypothetical protein
MASYDIVLDEEWLSKNGVIAVNDDKQWIPRWRLLSVGGKHRLIDLATGEDISNKVASVTVHVEFDDISATIKTIDGMALQTSYPGPEVDVEIPQNAKPVKFREFL